MRLFTVQGVAIVVDQPAADEGDVKIFFGQLEVDFG
jgi:hypothetical protein